MPLKGNRPSNERPRRVRRRVEEWPLSTFLIPKIKSLPVLGDNEGRKDISMKKNSVGVEANFSFFFSNRPCSHSDSWRGAKHLGESSSTIILKKFFLKSGNYRNAFEYLLRDSCKNFMFSIFDYFLGGSNLNF